jgi:hypothetical protein
LQHSYINEANPLMSTLYETHPALFLTLKFALSCLLYVIGPCITVHPPYWLKGLSAAAAAFYTCICLYHGYWMLLVIEMIP